MNKSINSEIEKIKNLLTQAATLSRLETVRFFKTGKGDYAEGDMFIGVSVPKLRKIAKQYNSLVFDDLKLLISSKFNEERLLALLILVNQFNKSALNYREKIYNFYLDNIIYVNNWNLVDASAHLIIGDYLYKRDRSILLTLACSNFMWQRRIAIVATWYFIKKHDLAWTFRLADMLLSDSHDLIHKAVGWMLREAGKRDKSALMRFLDQHGAMMPRTMLRYSIEKFSDNERKHYLLITKIK